MRGPCCPPALCPLPISHDDTVMQEHYTPRLQHCTPTLGGGSTALSHCAVPRFFTPTQTFWGTARLTNRSFCYTPKNHCTALGSILLVGLMNGHLTKPSRVFMQHSREAILARETCAQTLMARGQASEALHYYQVRRYKIPKGFCVQMTLLEKGAVLVACVCSL